ncbi:radical SAM protein [bacterium]|nr:radical SAM protein [bacterium]
MDNLENYKRSSAICDEAPYTLFIEPTNHCNLACTFCPQKDQTREKGFMSREVFLSLLEDAQEIGVKKINLFFLGESLMHKELFFMIKEIVDRGLECRLNTNASFLDRKKATELLNTWIQHITISFEGVNKEVYESLRVKGNYEVTLANIKTVIELKHELKSDCQVTIEIIELEETKEFIPEFKRQMSLLNPDQLNTKVYRNWIGYLSSLKSDDLSSHYNVCSYPWRSMAVLWDGTFVPCCVDFDGIYPLGKNVKIMDAWNSKEMVQLRKWLIARKTDFSLKKTASACSGLCSDCDIPFQKDDHPQ